jgi:hypothetical protein
MINLLITSKRHKYGGGDDHGMVLGVIKHLLLSGAHLGPVLKCGTVRYSK